MTWLDRSLFVGPHVALVTSEKQFRSAKKAAGVQCEDPMLEHGWHACVHSYWNDDRKLICIVAISLPACAHMSGIEIAALLVHESVHVWQRVRNSLGPGELGSEMEAYAVQNIAKNLMHAYSKAFRK